MKVIDKVIELRKLLDTPDVKDKIVGFVPTMGALHDGHMSLIEAAKKECDIVVASVFVNPTQFDNAEDLEKYPRTLEKDASLLEKHDCDYLFSPTVDEMYPADYSNKYKYDFANLTNTMEGEHRDGHFEGVAEVVGRLLEIVKPDKMFMGQKDFQQVAVVRRLVELMESVTEVISCPTKRAKDGLALSSRNVRLTGEERALAPFIFLSLSYIRSQKDKKSIAVLIEECSHRLNAIDGVEVEYITIADSRTLQPIEKWDETENIVVCTAVKVGAVRLIDNMVIS